LKGCVPRSAPAPPRRAVANDMRARHRARGRAAQRPAPVSNSPARVPQFQCLAAPPWRRPQREKT